MKNIFFIPIIALIGYSCQNLSADERLANLNDAEKELLVEEIKHMIAEDQHYREEIKKLSELEANYSENRDSLLEIQHKVDKYNNKNLLDITLRYGFPSAERLGEPILAWRIFQHSPQEFHEELKFRIKDEFEKGRIPSSEYAALNRHFNGNKVELSSINE